MQKYLGDELLTKDGVKPTGSVLSQKRVIAFYFSAHWCPPCRQFTPQLINLYKTWTSQGKPIEVVFVSGDNDLEQFNEYFGEMPWSSIPYENEELRQGTMEECGVSGIPALLVFNADGKLLTRDGRADVSKLKEGAVDSWLNL